MKSEKIQWDLGARELEGKIFNNPIFFLGALITLLPVHEHAVLPEQSAMRWFTRNTHSARVQIITVQCTVKWLKATENRLSFVLGTCKAPHLPADSWILKMSLSTARSALCKELSDFFIEAEKYSFQ